MKRYVVLVLLLLISFVSFADDNDDSEYPDTWDTGSGYYLGTDLGYVNTHAKSRSNYRDVPGVQQAFNQRQWGFGGRAFVGYLFNPNFGVETGYDYMPISKAVAKSLVDDSTSGVSTKQYALDFLFLIKIPFEKDFDVYMKGGMAYVSGEESIGGVTQKSNAAVYRPAFGFGWDYRITNSLTFNVEWYRITGKANAFDGPAQAQQLAYGHSYLLLPIVDMYMTGFSYRF